MLCVTDTNGVQPRLLPSPRSRTLACSHTAVYSLHPISRFVASAFTLYAILAQFFSPSKVFNHYHLAPSPMSLPYQHNHFCIVALPLLWQIKIDLTADNSRSVAWFEIGRHCFVGCRCGPVRRDPAVL